MKVGRRAVVPLQAKETFERESQSVSLLLARIGERPRVVPLFVFRVVRAPVESEAVMVLEDLSAVSAPLEAGQHLLAPLLRIGGAQDGYDGGCS